MEFRDSCQTTIPFNANCRWRQLAIFIVLTALCASVVAVEIQGHRGARGLWPENTLAGFEGALRIGVDVLELDVGLSRDGVPVVSHDPTLSPEHTRDANGQWLDSKNLVIRQLSAAQLRAYDVGRLRPDSRSARRFPRQAAVDGQKMPRLRDVFALVERLGAEHVRFNIELKLRPEPTQWFADAKAFARAVHAEIKAAGMAQRVTVQGFDWRALLAMREIDPDIELAALTVEQSWLDNLARGQPGASAWTAGFDLDDHDGSVPHLVHAVGAKVWSPYWREVDAQLLAQAHRLGLTVSVWTVNEPADIEAMLDLGVDSIISDFPDRVRASLARRKQRLPPQVAGR